MTYDLIEAAKEVAKEYEADVYLYAGPVSPHGYGSLIKEISKYKDDQPRSQNALMIINTLGGNANAAYQIARLLQAEYENFILCIPSYCKSAGTLLALGANSLIMGLAGELGPLDVQLLMANEIGGRKSGLLSKSSFEALGDESFDLFQKFMLNIKRNSNDLISFRVASDIAADMVCGLMAPVYGQINPETVGSDLRDVRIAHDYGIRLAEQSGNPNPDTVERLISSYPSHDFVIDALEANELFKRVAEPTPSVYALITCLGHIIYVEPDPPIVLRLDVEDTAMEDHDAETEIDDDIREGEPAEADPEQLAGVRGGSRRRNSAKRLPSPEGGGEDSAPAPEPPGEH